MKDLVLVFSSRPGRTSPPLDLPILGPGDWRAQRPAGQQMYWLCPGADITSRAVISLSLSSGAQETVQEFCRA